MNWKPTELDDVPALNIPECHHLEATILLRAGGMVREASLAEQTNQTESPSEWQPPYLHVPERDGLEADILEYVTLKQSLQEDQKHPELEELDVPLLGDPPTTYVASRIIAEVKSTNQEKRFFNVLPFKKPRILKISAIAASLFVGVMMIAFQQQYQQEQLVEQRVTDALALFSADDNFSNFQHFSEIDSILPSN